MYTPSHFDNRDLAAQHALMRRHPFALLVTVHAGETHLTHLPFHLDAAKGANGTLEAHLAKVNPHCAAILAGAPSVVVFKGPDAYVSPRWYVDPARNVPTWNYVAVHAHGAPRSLQEPAALLALIGRLTDEHEAYIERPWSIREAGSYTDRLVNHIVGFELPIERIEGKFKLSQNRSDGDRAGVLREFAKSRDPGVSEMLELMRGLYTDEGTFR
ncbi:MAG TPA: FMN-binding negative transcriptional regulator [Gammaproteobacteria bacterium]